MITDRKTPTMYFDSPTDAQIDAFNDLPEMVAIARVKRVTGARFDTLGDAAEMFYSLSPELAARALAEVA